MTSTGVEQKSGMGHRFVGNNNRWDEKGKIQKGIQLVFEKGQGL